MTTKKQSARPAKFNKSLARFIVFKGPFAINFQNFKAALNSVYRFF